MTKICINNFQSLDSLFKLYFNQSHAQISQKYNRDLTQFENEINEDPKHLE